MSQTNGKIFYRITNAEIYEKLQIIEDKLEANKFQEKLQWVATGFLAIFVGLGKYFKLL